MRKRKMQAYKVTEAEILLIQARGLIKRNDVLSCFFFGSIGDNFYLAAQNSMDAEILQCLIYTVEAAKHEGIKTNSKFALKELNEAMEKLENRIRLNIKIIAESEKERSKCLAVWKEKNRIFSNNK